MVNRFFMDLTERANILLYKQLKYVFACAMTTSIVVTVVLYKNEKLSLPM
jgi:hypothetical protein